MTDPKVREMFHWLADYMDKIDDAIKRGHTRKARSYAQDVRGYLGGEWGDLNELVPNVTKPRT